MTSIVKDGSTEKLHTIIHHIGMIDYRICYEAMKNYTLNRTNESSPCQFWLVEHPPSYTLNTIKAKTNIKQPLPYPLYHTDRGGDITYHGPGQIIIYWLLDLKKRTDGINKLAESAEKFIISWLKKFNITAYGDKNARGVYVDGEKIASIGFKVHQRYIYHGIAINVAMNLQPFKAINPCGLNIKMTEMSKHTTVSLQKQKVYQQLIEHLIEHFNLKKDEIKIIQDNKEPWTTEILDV